MINHLNTFFFDNLIIRYKAYNKPHYGHHKIKAARKDNAVH